MRSLTGKQSKTWRHMVWKVNTNSFIPGIPLKHRMFWSDQKPGVFYYHQSWPDDHMWLAVKFREFYFSEKNCVHPSGKYLAILWNFAFDSVYPFSWKHICVETWISKTLFYYGYFQVVTKIDLELNCEDKTIIPVMYRSTCFRSTFLIYTVQEPLIFFLFNSNRILLTPLTLQSCSFYWSTRRHRQWQKWAKFQDFFPDSTPGFSQVSQKNKIKIITKNSQYLISIFKYFSTVWLWNGKMILIRKFVLFSWTLFKDERKFEVLRNRCTEIWVARM